MKDLTRIQRTASFIGGPVDGDVQRCVSDEAWPIAIEFQRDAATVWRYDLKLMVFDQFTCFCYVYRGYKWQGIT